MGQVCFGFLRALIIIVNMCVAAMSVLLLYLSFSAMDRDFGMDSLNDNHPKVVHAYISTICAGVGIIVALLSLLGMFGAIRKSKSLLSMYGAIIFFMIVILAILAGTTLTIRSSSFAYRDVDKAIVNSTISVYSHTDSNDFKTKLIDQAQRKLSCCGMNSPDDWKNYGLRKISKACCTNHTEAVQPAHYKFCEQSDYKIGCWKALTDLFHSNLSTARLVLYILIGFGLICVASAYSMVRTLNRSLEVV